MALLLCSNPLSASLRSSSFSSSAFPSSGFTLPLKSNGLNSKHCNGVQFQINLLVVNKTGSMVVKAATDTDGAGLTENNVQNTTLENIEVAASIEKLTLESKLQERMEQKTRMKLAKKIRLRRKRLVRKRRLRKKGRWPPSKMKKLKNV